MRRRLWLSAAAVAIAAVLVAAVPVLVVVAIRDPALLALGLPLLAGAVGGAVALARVVADRAARPVEELAEAAGWAPVTPARSAGVTAWPSLTRSPRAWTAPRGGSRTC